MERKKTFLERLTGTTTLNEERPTYKQERSSMPEREKFEQNVLRENSAVDTEENEIDAEETEDEQVAGLAIDMYETDNELIIQGMIAGVAPENLHISITRDVVTIAGKRIAPEIPESNYITQELYWGIFSRAIELPFEIDTDGAEAVEKYGLLIIRLPKLDNNKAQVLKVKAI